MTHTYLRTLPNLWPIFSTKNYVRDVYGWWNYVKSSRQIKNLNILRYRLKNIADSE